MVETALDRKPVLTGRSAEIQGVALVPGEPASRISLRVGAAGTAAMSAALGLDLPRQPKTSMVSGARAALWLGPDEWLVLDDGEADLPALCAPVTVLHSAVDVSHRNVAIFVSGARAADVINSGCPQDLSLDAFAIGACSRTVLGKVEIVLWRMGPDRFRIEVWRSFADYAFALLEDAAGAGT